MSQRCESLNREHMFVMKLLEDGAEHRMLHRPALYPVAGFWFGSQFWDDDTNCNVVTRQRPINKVTSHVGASVMGMFLKALSILDKTRKVTSGAASVFVKLGCAISKTHGNIDRKGGRARVTIREGLIFDIKSFFLRLAAVEVTNHDAQTIRVGGPMRGNEL